MVVSHAFITGGSGSESERSLEIGGIGDAPSSIFTGVDYTAMGHLHGAQVISSSGRFRSNREVLGVASTVFIF